MKVYTYDLDGKRFASTILPAAAANVIVYDKSNLVDVSSIYSNAIENNWVAQLIIFFWDHPEREDVVEID